MATRTLRKYFHGSHGSPSGQEKARTRVLNLLETPERAATLACSDSIKTSPEDAGKYQQTTKGHAFFMEKYVLKRQQAPKVLVTKTKSEPNNCHARAKGAQSLKPSSWRLLFEFIYCSQHFRAVPAWVHAPIGTRNLPLRIN